MHEGTFLNPLRALHVDGGASTKRMATLGVRIAGAWLAWFLLAEVTVYDRPWVGKPRGSTIALIPGAPFTDAKPLQPVSTPHSGEHVEVEHPAEPLCESLLAVSSASSAPSWPLPQAPRAFQWPSTTFTGRIRCG